MKDKQKSGFNIGESEVSFLVLISIGIESGALGCLNRVLPVIEWTNRGSPIYATALGLVPPALERLKPKINQQSIKHATRKVPEGLIRYISYDQSKK